MIQLLLITFICFTSVLFAADEPLNVGIEDFNPPFIMQGSNNALYGFDIEMMSSVCKTIHRTCKFQMMPFKQLLDAVANKKIDVAIDSIAITPERAKIVNFSLPYLLSYSRLLVIQSSTNEKFGLAQLNNKTIGLEKDTAFRQQINDMGLQNPTIKEYHNSDDQLNALKKGEVDYILLDNAAAIFWSSNASDTFKTLGPPLVYGNGYGIAINASETNLINDINAALVQYQNSIEYKENYDKYLSEF